MIGDQIRDKDAVSAVAIICEMAAVEKNKGRSLFDKLLELYQQHGFYLEDLVSVTRKGMNGQKEIADMMERFRKETPETLGGLKVTRLLDYQLQRATDLKSGSSEGISLPKSNVLQFVLEDGSKVSARPSGTEPKIKFYFSVRSDLKDRSDHDKVKSELQEKIRRIIADLNVG
jgi:phosphoglucomutase